MAKRNIFGLTYDSKTGKVTFENGEKPSVGADFTFEDIGNPLQFATQETGEKLVEILADHFGPKIKFTLELKKSAFTPDQYAIRAERDGIHETLIAGLVANSIIRNGGLSSIQAELKYLGLLF
jgi:hypothetical protein